MWLAKMSHWMMLMLFFSDILPCQYLNWNSCQLVLSSQNLPTMCTIYISSFRGHREHESNMESNFPWTESIEFTAFHVQKFTFFWAKKLWIFLLNQNDIVLMAFIYHKIFKNNTMMLTWKFLLEAITCYFLTDAELMSILVLFVYCTAYLHMY